MKKSIPDTMFTDREQIRLSQLQNWILDHGVTEIVMTERQFWKFASVQPVAEKPWDDTSWAARSASRICRKAARSTGLVTSGSPARFDPRPDIDAADAGHGVTPVSRKCS